MNQIVPFALVCVFVTINLQAQVEADQSCDRWDCIFLLTNQERVRKQFSQIDHSKIWLVYLNLTEQPKGSPDNSKQTLMLTWTHSPNSPFLTFDSNFEVYSFSLLTEAVAKINMQAESEGPDPSSDCLNQLPVNCRNRTIAKEILRKVTDMKGAVCFGQSPSRQCCQYCDGDIKCGIEPESGWRWLNIDYLSEIFGFVGYFFLPILLYLLPTLPDSHNDIEVTGLLDPSPLSLFNIFVKCFNYRPAQCFRDVLITVCCRLTVYLGLFPSVFYLNNIAFRKFSKKVCFAASDQDTVHLFHNLGFFEVVYYIFAGFAVIVSVAPFLQYFLQCDDRESYWRGGFCFNVYTWFLHYNGAAVLAAKSYVKSVAAVNYSFLFYGIPFCFQDKREISKLFNCPLCLYVVLSPCLLVVCFIVFLGSILTFPLVCLILYPITRNSQFLKSTAALRVCFLGVLMPVYVMQLFIITYDCINLASFATYTIIGFVLNYKMYLPLLSAAILAITYVNQFYRSTNESYDNLRRLAFEVCTEMQAELNNYDRNQQLTAGTSLLHIQQQSQNGERQPLLSSQPRQLVYFDKNGSQLIPKTLFENICWELKPAGLAFLSLAAKVFTVVIFVITLVGVVLTLTPRSEFGTLTQTAITIFVGGLPKILSVFSTNSSEEKLQTMETKSRIRRCISIYLEQGELSEEEFLNKELNSI